MQNQQFVWRSVRRGIGWAFIIICGLVAGGTVGPRIRRFAVNTQFSYAPFRLGYIPG
jgi:hypothetical protein